MLSTLHIGSLSQWWVSKTNLYFSSGFILCTLTLKTRTFGLAKAEEREHQACAAAHAQAAYAHAAHTRNVTIS